MQQEQGMHGQVGVDAIAVAVDIDEYAADKDFVDDDGFGHGGMVLLVNSCKLTLGSREYFGRLNTCGRDGRSLASQHVSMVSSFPRLGAVLPAASRTESGKEGWRQGKVF